MNLDRQFFFQVYPALTGCGQEWKSNVLRSYCQRIPNHHVLWAYNHSYRQQVLSLISYQASKNCNSVILGLWKQQNYSIKPYVLDRQANFRVSNLSYVSVRQLLGDFFGQQLQESLHTRVLTLDVIATYHWNPQDGRLSLFDYFPKICTSWKVPVQLSLSGGTYFNADNHAVYGRNFLEIDNP